MIKVEQISQESWEGSRNSLCKSLRTASGVQAFSKCYLKKENQLIAPKISLAESSSNLRSLCSQTLDFLWLNLPGYFRESSAFTKLTYL